MALVGDGTFGLAIFYVAACGELMSEQKSKDITIKYVLKAKKLHKDLCEEAYKNDEIQQFMVAMILVMNDEFPQTLGVSVGAGTITYPHAIELLSSLEERFKEKFREVAKDLDAVDKAFSEERQ